MTRSDEVFEIWHNPRCSKSRAALALLEQAGVELRVRRYLDDPPTVADLRSAIRRLGIAPGDLVRRRESDAKALGLDRGSPDVNTVTSALAENPGLIERPVVLAPDGHVVIGRPPERVGELLRRYAGGHSSASAKLPDRQRPRGRV